MADLDKLKVATTLKQYEHDLTLVFWFALHLEDLPLVKALLNQEFLLK